jgi:type II secretory pathway pseudopilin PulG
MPCNKGYTLLELLIYVGVITLVIAAMSVLLMWGIRLRAKIQAQEEVFKQTERAMAVMLAEIREAQSVYTPTSIFATSTGQLSLRTLRHIPQGEESGYIDFFLCGTRVCMKEESQNPVAITSENIIIESLVFDLIGKDTGFPSIRISISSRYNTQAQRPEYQAVVTLRSSATLRRPQ